MNQKPTLERIVTVGVVALAVISLIFLFNRSLGVPPIIKRVIVLLLLTGVVAALVESAKQL